MGHPCVLKNNSADLHRELFVDLTPEYSLDYMIPQSRNLAVVLFAPVPSPSFRTALRLDLAGCCLQIGWDDQKRRTLWAARRMIETKMREPLCVGWHCDQKLTQTRWNTRRGRYRDIDVFTFRLSSAEGFSSGSFGTRIKVVWVSRWQVRNESLNLSSVG